MRDLWDARKVSLRASFMEDHNIDDFEFGEDEDSLMIFRPYVDLVLYAFGFSPDEALWVSDESITFDFIADDEDLFNASQRLGFELRRAILFGK